MSGLNKGHRLKMIFGFWDHLALLIQEMCCEFEDENVNKLMNFEWFRNWKDSLIAVFKIIGTRLKRLRRQEKAPAVCPWSAT